MSSKYSDKSLVEFDGEVRHDRDTRNAVQTKPDLVCFSHLRWDFVHQRPQHLLKRCARDRRVFFVEEPIFDNGTMRLDIAERERGVWRVVPHLPEGLQSQVAVNAVLQEMVRHLFRRQGIRQFVIWYYTPMALPFTVDLKPRAIIYDCMDELSAFKNAPENLMNLEQELFQKADLVFTGGQSLYEAKRGKHHSVYAFPSSIDREHFMNARQPLDEPEDQKEIPHPRLGFFGVIDERFDIDLLDKLARTRPDWHFVMLGPAVKIDPSVLPQHKNIHYLGPKKYEELPSYIAGWDVALLLFALNESTRFISPTKTPEYLAAGKPVVSTPIRDVVSPYGEMGLVNIADGREAFSSAIEKALAESDRAEWLKRVDLFLSNMSWDETWSRMSGLIDQVLQQKSSAKLLTATAVSQGGIVGI
jgi:UDP-galactopyranose mutase